MSRRINERGAAVVDFILISLVFLPLILGIFQLTLFLHVRNTTVACAQEGARKAANYNATLEEGVERTRTCIAGALNPRFAERITPSNVEGPPAKVKIRVDAVMPPLGFFLNYRGGGSLGVPFPVSGHAVKEPGPL